MLTGVLPPDAGEVRLGTNLVQVTLDQRRESLDPEQSLAEALTRGSGDTVTVGGQSRHVIGYMGDFLFRPEQARTRSACCPAASGPGSPWPASSPVRPIC
jgi:ATP-binding cassette subfamily F protein uup